MTWRKVTELDRAVKLNHAERDVFLDRIAIRRSITRNKLFVVFRALKQRVVDCFRGLPK